MKYLIIALALISAVIIAGCTSDLNASPYTKKLPTDNPCYSVNCVANQECVDGSCICEQGFKDCNGACIAADGCCSNSDCTGGKLCQDGKCKASPQTCEFNQHWDLEYEECSCDEGTKYCSSQNACISSKNCCAHIDCGRGERCVPQGLGTRICLNDDNKHCKALIEGMTGSWFINNSRFDITVKNIIEQEKVRVLVNETEEILVPGIDIPYLGYRLYAEEGITVAGGRCESDDR